MGLEGFEFQSRRNPSYFKKYYDADPSVSKIEGLEEPFSHQLTDRVQSHARLAWAIGGHPDYAPKLDLHKAGFFLDFSKNEYLAEAWLSSRDEIRDSAVKETIDKVVRDRDSSQEVRKDIRELLNSPAWKNNSQILQISKIISKKMVERAEHNYEMKSKLHMPNLESAYRFIDNPDDTKIEAEYENKVTLAWRNEIMADRVYQLFKQARAEHKELRINLGDDHLRDITYEEDGREVKILGIPSLLKKKFEAEFGTEDFDFEFIRTNG